MKKLLLVLTALSTIAACAAAAAPSAQVIAHAAPALEAPATELAGPPPAPVIATTAQREAAPVEQISASSRPACDIRATPTSHGVAISAVMTARAPISGDYELVITKSGPNGSSEVQQGGAFNAGRGERVTLGQTELGLDHGDRFHAVLTLTDADGRVCRDELRS